MFLSWNFTTHFCYFFVFCRANLVSSSHRATENVMHHDPRQQEWSRQTFCICLIARERKKRKDTERYKIGPKSLWNRIYRFVHLPCDNNKTFVCNVSKIGKFWWKHQSIFMILVLFFTIFCQNWLSFLKSQMRLFEKKIPLWASRRECLVCITRLCGFAMC